MGWGRTGVKDRVAKLPGICAVSDRSGEVVVSDAGGPFFRALSWNAAGRGIETIRELAQQRASVREVGQAEKKRRAKGRTVRS